MDNLVLTIPVQYKQQVEHITTGMGKQTVPGLPVGRAVLPRSTNAIRSGESDSFPRGS